MTKLPNQIFQDNNIKSVGLIGSGADVELPDSITTISSGAFSSNQITSVILPNSVIAVNGFSNNQITNLVFGNNVQSIGQYSFAKNKLTNLIIPVSVTSIEYWAFIDNSTLSSVSFENTNGWVATYYDDSSNVISNLNLSNPSTNAEYFKSTYRNYDLTRN